MCALTHRSAGNGFQLGFIAQGRWLAYFLVGTFDEEKGRGMEKKGKYPKALRTSGIPPKLNAQGWWQGRAEKDTVHIVLQCEFICEFPLWCQTKCRLLQPATSTSLFVPPPALSFSLPPRSICNPSPCSIFMRAFPQQETPTYLPWDIMGAKV